MINPVTSASYQDVHLFLSILAFDSPLTVALAVAWKLLSLKEKECDAATQLVGCHIGLSEKKEVGRVFLGPLSFPEF